MDQKGLSLNKYISSSGLCSRREADEMIEQGRVYVNGKPAEKASRVNFGDKVTVDGEVIKSKEKYVVIALNKPIGITCTTDKKDKTNIIDFIDYKDRIFPIGRLDKDSSGLILLTNNGDLVNRILREENNHEKEYLVTVNRPIGRDVLKAMAKGRIPVHRKLTKPCKTFPVSKYGFRIILTQGLNRQIRFMCRHFGYRVSALHRVRIMNINIGKLKPGQWRKLSHAEMNELERQMKSLNY